MLLHNYTRMYTFIIIIIIFIIIMLFINCLRFVLVTHFTNNKVTFIKYGVWVYHI